MAWNQSTTHCRKCFKPLTIENEHVEYFKANDKEYRRGTCFECRKKQIRQNARIKKFDEKYIKTVGGKLNKIYFRIKKWYIEKNIPYCTKQEFLEIAKKLNFHAKFSKWALAGYPKSETPSFCRIDKRKGFVKGNIILTTATEAHRHSTLGFLQKND